ncbi:hypothetical protein L2E82_40099 [Cichorium intybus]|uniref:Uncharacterized protein n=1 Tax=Cichorium intybus TaxID=13427 RepID=A0ACB9ALF2_CICIN|nr:hypothetical protein L2E82_40099 [Cichorium intybus]
MEIRLYSAAKAGGNKKTGSSIYLFRIVLHRHRSNPILCFKLLETNKSVTVEELAEMIFGSAAPVESYCAHLLLSRDEIYFVVLHSKGSYSVYATKTLLLIENPKVEEMKRRIFANDAADKEFNEFLELLKSAKAMPPPLEGCCSGLWKKM